jgi:thiol-disulfide isomerase/thioredoxin
MRNLKTNKKVKITLILFFNLFFLLSGYFNWPIQFSINAFSILAILYFFKNDYLYYKLLLLISPILYSILTIIDKNYHTIPISISPFLLLLIHEFLFKKITNNWFLIILFSLTSFLSYIFMIWWLDYYFNKDNYNLINSKLPYFQTTSSNNLSDELYSINDTIKVIDCWTTNCGNCITGFSKYSEIQNVYLNKKVKFYTLNFPIKRDSIIKTKKILSKNYDRGNNLFANDTNAINLLKIPAVPLYMIVKNGEILYFGNTNIEQKLFQIDLCDEIDKLLLQ